MKNFVFSLLMTVCFLSFRAQVRFESKHENGLIKESGTLLNGRKTGQWLEYLITGKLKSVFNFSNDTLHGYFAEFEMNGNMKREGFHHRGEISGTEYQYEDGILIIKINWLKPETVKGKRVAHYKETQYSKASGKTRAEGYMLGEKKDSTWTFYSEEGKIKAAETFRHGKRHGTAVRYYPNGNLAEKAEFAYGEFNGTRLMLTENGDTTEYGNYTSNKRDGYFILRENVAVPDLIEDTRTFIICGSYKQGAMHGRFVLKHLNGVTAAEEDYTEGKLNGKRKLYNERGILVYDGEFSDNKIHGTVKHYYPDGKLRKQSSYSHGIIKGTEQNYFPNGKVSEEANYENGVIKKLTRYYDSGIKRQVITYENGKMTVQQNYDEKGRPIKSK